jgi:acyl-CoA reductase-like NAD-dependent aldehyde dehydrogenase
MTPTVTQDRSSSSSATNAVPSPAATDQRALDETIRRVQEGARRFVQLSLDERIELARSMQRGYANIAERSVRASCAAKGIPLDTPLEGEEWTLGPWHVMRHLRLLIESLTALKRTGNTPIGKLGQTIDGRVTVQVFPASTFDKVFFAGVSVDVHLQPGVSVEEMHALRASFYKGHERPHDGIVVLVLGAGNVASIAPQDVLTKMFNEGKACILKMHPVNGYLGPFLEEAFSDAIARNFLAIVYGGAAEGAYLAQHDGVDELHITGSDKTHDLIVWGAPGREREERMKSGTPLARKKVTSELGNVSPVLVVPGPYSSSELAFQASAVAGAVAHNASFNCNATKILVLPRGWAAGATFLAEVERALRLAPIRQAYYPGASERWHSLVDGRGDVRTLDAAPDGSLPWTIMSGLSADHAEERAFSMEPFCSILSETEVGSSDPVEFLDEAVTFANERLWGTLSAAIVVHPASLRDPRIADALERAIIRLRYGAVGVNGWPAMVFSFGTPPWGAHPSSTLADIQSGRGFVHNTPMLEGIEKAVIRFPLKSNPKPVIFPGHRSAHTLMRRFSRFEERPSWAKVPGVLAAAMRG